MDDTIAQNIRLESLDVRKHAQQLFDAGALDPHASGWTYLPYGPFEVFEDSRAWLEQQSGARDPLFFAIVDPRNGEAIGLASYLRISPSCGSIEVGHLHFSSKMQRPPAAIDKEWPALHAAFEQWLSPLNFDADGRQCVSLSSLIRSILK